MKKKAKRSRQRRPRPRRVPVHRTTLVVCGIASASSVALTAGSTNFTWQASLTVRESFDSNVYMYDVEPDLTAVPQAVSPFQESFVTSINPKVGLGWKPGEAFNLDVDYAPDVVFYHAEPGEDHVTHLGHANAKGKVGELPWQTGNTFKWVQGSTEGLYFGGPGGFPAIGGIPIRDRRAQFVYLGNLSIRWDVGDWFFRPLANAYYHDFHTVQRDPVLHPGYESYIDRREFNAGFDFGRPLDEKTRVYLGYRYGQEIQGRTVVSPYHYDSEHHRPVVGIEGQPLSWLKANASVGPDIHHTIGDYDPRFDPDYTSVWADVVVTITPTARDTVVLTWKQNTQPAFAGCSVYDDIVYDIGATHRLDSKWSVGAGFRLYIGNWLAPANREDWIYTVRGGVTYKPHEDVTLEFTYSYDWAESMVPNTEGREFTRHLAGLSGTYRF